MSYKIQIHILNWINKCRANKQIDILIPKKKKHLEVTSIGSDTS